MLDLGNNWVSGGSLLTYFGRAWIRYLKDSAGGESGGWPSSQSPEQWLFSTRQDHQVTDPFQVFSMHFFHIPKYGLTRNTLDRHL